MLACLTGPTTGLHKSAALHGIILQLGRSMASLTAWLGNQCLPLLPTSASGRYVQAAPTAAGVRGILFPLSIKQTQASLSLTQMMGQVTSSGLA